ncbi:hypothetical protein ACQEVB_26365 [Pseudonocardia sp. CA-107938]|uniref:hypothetical protein n=1 Tax=Pseudonocardia sp. CA-107938 TaxID=3240021 RepID=UPI003D8ADB69
MSPIPPTRHALRTAITAALTLALTTLLAFTTTAAFAAESGRQTVKNSDRVCMQANAEFTWNPGSPGGFAVKQASVEMFALNPGSCQGTLTLPARSMRIRLDLYKLENGSWTRCQRGQWEYGGGGDTRSGDIVYEQTATSRQVYSTPPCGPGTYRARALPRVWNGSAWEGEAENITLDSPEMNAT